MILLVLEGILNVGASVLLQSGSLRVLAIAKPNYKRREPNNIRPEDLLDTAKTGDTVEAFAEASPIHSDFADALYHDLNFA